MREKGAEGNDLLDRLAADERLRLTRGRPRAPWSPTRSTFTGAARRRSPRVVARVDAVVAAHPEPRLRPGRDPLARCPSTGASRLR